MDTISFIRKIRNSSHFNVVAGVVVAVAVGAVGYTLFFAHAAGPFALANTSGSTVSGNASLVADSTSSQGQALQFGIGSISGTPPPPPSSNVSCEYTSHSTANVNGYTVTELSHQDGNPASFSVKLDANPTNKNVIGYPAEQCLLYSPTMPANLTSSYKITPPANSSGLDYEYAYDIWINTPANLKSSNMWNGQTEIMYWVYNNGQRPATGTDGPIKTLPDGSALWYCSTTCDNYSEPIISIVAPKNTTSGTLNIPNLINEIHSLGYDVDQTGIIDVEFGVEVPYGGGQTFTVNSLSVSE